jgi:hypothetical protein
MDSLTLQPHASRLNNLICHERVDVNALSKLIHSSLLKPIKSKWKLSYFSSEKQQLTKYLSLIKHGYAVVHYEKYSGSVWGRCNPNNMNSLFGLRREIRHSIAHKYYTDVDIDNCHPTMLYQLCLKHNIPCEYLEKYVLNRSEYLDKVKSYYDVDYDDAKLLFIILLYCGGFKKWAKEVKTDKPALEFIENFTNEFRIIAEVISNKNPLIKQDVIARKAKQNKTDYNLLNVD